MGYDALRVTVIGGNTADFAALKLDRRTHFACYQIISRNRSPFPSITDR